MLTMACYRRATGGRHPDILISPSLASCIVVLYPSSARRRESGFEALHEERHELAAVPIAHTAYRGDDSAAAAAGPRPLSSTQWLPASSGAAAAADRARVLSATGASFLPTSRRHFISLQYMKRLQRPAAGLAGSPAVRRLQQQQQQLPKSQGDFERRTEPGPGAPLPTSLPQRLSDCLTSRIRSRCHSSAYALSICEVHVGEDARRFRASPASCFCRSASGRDRESGGCSWILD